MSQNEEFIKIINDFTKDLQKSYPEFTDMFSVIDYDEYFSHCKNIYPENFFTNTEDARRLDIFNGSKILRSNPLCLWFRD